MDFLKIPNLEVNNGGLFMDGQDLVQIAKEYEATMGSPVYIFSEKRLKSNVSEILDTFRNYHKNTTLHYASKAETTLAILQVIRKAGSFLEVNSGGELFKGLKAGFLPEEIVFNGVGKTEKEIEYAVINHIKAINVDSFFELERIVKTAGRLGKKANIMLRIVPEVATNVIKGDETGTHETKFGISMDELDSAVKYTLEHKENLHLTGLHFHIGSQTYHLESFVAAFRVLLETCIDIYKKTGYQPRILDIGGGLPVPHYMETWDGTNMPDNIYRMLQGSLTIEEIAKAVTREMKREAVASWAGSQLADFFEECELIIESGRKVVADAGVIMSQVVSTKRRNNLNENWLIIDAGINTMLEVKTYHWFFPMACANKMEEAHSAPYKIAGPLCESGDVWFDCDHHKDLPDFR
ncbi:MAG: hypothetical protein HGA25_03760, partial [Clostridiales bacterium]|nr:hypothetical protein [Clostridiales bacterium]